MSYLVLARKYRPRSFQEVAGQDVVTRVLAGAIAEERIGHAYLFSGPRGTGKTTSARLFAKALNCERGPTADPCGECERCQASEAGTEIDIVEIDAASNTSVDFVRQLRDQAAYMPLRARFKVYIIDEVHMLSRSAFNALLKTLEEPPPHVKFLFATTEPHKVPDTILSRCQVLRLSPISEETIAERLDEIFGREEVSAEEGVTSELARRARGGMRDALSMADQLLALVGAKPKLEDLTLLSSEGSTAGIEAVLDRALDGDRAGVLTSLPLTEGGEAQFLTGLLDYLRGCLLAALCGADAPMLVAAGSGEARQKMAERGKRIGAARLEQWLGQCLHARERMRLLPAHARLVLELTLLDLCNSDPLEDLTELAGRLLALEDRLDAAPSAASPPRPSEVPRATTPTSESAAPPSAAPPGPEPSDELPAARPARKPAAAARGPRVRTNSTQDTWDGFLEELAGTAAGLAEILQRRGRLVESSEDRAHVQLVGLTDEELLMVNDRRNQRVASKAFSAAVGRKVEVVLGDLSRARPGGKDPFTQEVADLFQGRIEE